jgi:hypothetical protein
MKLRTLVEGIKEKEKDVKIKVEESNMKKRENA